MKPWKKRFVLIILILASVAIGAGIILKTFNENILFFYSPTDLIERNIAPSSKIIRVGGLVKIGSIKKINDNSEIEFIITDNQNELTIHYSGILPNLFKEKQGTVALGVLKTPNYFEAKELLAKHDENYIPKEIADTLK
ncbi:MAG: cytochrome c maturation protein CcmE [Candidatus Jidaibacter sp.]|jgi:cytochrome c-type biogenesis protein CcmE|nr:cytochrome c maturation protein CcmE [Candidatus Jidaibacter sp.]